MSRVAVVTGAARGIGAAIVDALVNEGYRVVAVDRCRDVSGVDYALATKADLDAVVERHGEVVLGLVGDVRSAADMRLAVETATRHFGRLDVAVGAAGVFSAGAPVWEGTDDNWDAVFSVNVLGVKRLIDAAAPTLIANGRDAQGRIVAVASMAATKGLYHVAPYVASKHAVLGLVRAAAVDLAEHGVTVNAVSPGSTRTAILDASAAVYGIDIEEFATKLPIGRLLEPSEIAQAVAWLCSPAASALTGANIAVDGGDTAR